MILLQGALLGLGATILFDLWLVLRSRGLPDMTAMGRWVGHMPEGVFRHENIAATPVYGLEIDLAPHHRSQRHRRR